MVESFLNIFVWKITVDILDIETAVNFEIKQTFDSLSLFLLVHSYIFLKFF